MVYKIAEKFKSVQGEGVYAGTPMAFIRFVGCSVGKKICQHCDTDFDATMLWRGGGEFTCQQLRSWTESHDHVCLTGGEPFDQDLLPLLNHGTLAVQMIHIETSGTVLPPVEVLTHRDRLWICVSPKPGWNETMIEMADEVKVIVPGLGNGPGWPTLDDALRWAEQMGKIVFLQPRNAKQSVDKMNLKYVLDLLRDYPQFRLSCQLHKILGEQ